MKILLIGLLALGSISAFAANVEFTQQLPECGGKMELRKHLIVGTSKYSLKFINVVRCPNILLSNGEKFKLVCAEDSSTECKPKSIRLSHMAVDAAQSGRLYVDECKDKLRILCAENISKS